MSQLPQNNEAFDYNPEYAKLYQEDDSEQSSPDASDEQLLSANESPDDSPDEPADQAVGKGMANFSILFGFLGPLSFFLGGWLIVQGFGENGTQVVIFSPLLSILGLCLGISARRHGARATGGLVLNGLGICFFLCIAFLIMLIANALSNMSNMH
ncbi:hypothetical protein [uncultured Rothia sp.]|uniref:hypothetical protein n=1 Tax=uncultured Rothia sp. TaxID=316088 RepID=UPI0025F4EF55|nr:hypothetical protein [uncultured Rothia sp.]